MPRRTNKWGPPTTTDGTVAGDGRRRFGKGQQQKGSKKESRLTAEKNRKRQREPPRSEVRKTWEKRSRLASFLV
jgi:hypothetical protein